MNGYLNYVVENCETAFDELCKINKELLAGMQPESHADVNHLGALNRMIQDYLIIRIGGLFDRTEHKVKGDIDEVISFEKIFSGNQDFENIKKEEVIKYIIQQRHNFVAHSNQTHINTDWPVTSTICDSNLKEVLQKLHQLLLKNGT